ncbi:Murein DD-endopeptidase MepS/Murein LD-carboxypeptidase [Ephemeroptericola cinctiostellae]|uniref:Murein DD-endopeptidase MepS/Murein LD-carboxypeptidase n=1 Tax=Ephemeroptericola cinctiostellae TaxID=2268024 RepID=A0A345DBU7_9BURK|nr:C40 family peptidase [Ephemeroptericola cinctiostellae]AXF85835.1 Murein DD-endopeptidase MepS/Murein LD-carboxypeptidase [Ephemeroptericola cinctiostellae]
MPLAYPHKLLSRLFLFVMAIGLTACSSTHDKRGRSGYSKPPSNITVGAGPNRALAVYAMKYLGTPYHYGGSSPSEGFDCSGLVQWSAKQSLNLNIPRSTDQQSQFGDELNVSRMAAGDLIFFNTSSQPNSHVGIYLGDGYFVHSPSSNGVVRVESLNNPYWLPRTSIARRIQ